MRTCCFISATIYGRQCSAGAGTEVWSRDRLAGLRPWTELRGCCARGRTGPAGSIRHGALRVRRDHRRTGMNPDGEMKRIGTYRYAGVPYCRTVVVNAGDHSTRLAARGTSPRRTAARRVSAACAADRVNACVKNLARLLAYDSGPRDTRRQHCRHADTMRP